jgi:hypothetical protein
MGHLAHCDATDFATLKKGVAFGTVTASHTIADFSLNGLTAASREVIEMRLDCLREMTSF